MPDVVNPHRPGFVGLLDGIDAGFAEAFLEDGVGETEVGTDSVVEGVVRCCLIVVAPG